MKTLAQMGGPKKFKDWRLGQEEAIQITIDCSARFSSLPLPTGAGKTAVYMAVALMTGARTCILTRTKALQNQLLMDFSGMGLLDVRGKNNYSCLPLSQGGQFHIPGTPSYMQSCEHGPCHQGWKCDIQKDGCHYFDSYREACKSNLVVTNYSYWMHIHKSGEGMGKFDLLILDEAHKAPDELANFMRIELNREDIGNTIKQAPTTRSPLDWMHWAAESSPQLVKDIATAENNKQRFTLSKVLRKLQSMVRMDKDWCVEQDQIYSTYKLDPISPARYNKHLFLDAPRVVLASATMNKKTCDLLGIHPNNLMFYEPKVGGFPIENRPFIHVPTVRMSHRTTDKEMLTWVNRIDQIIEGRLDRKGIIHTVSYKRRDFLLKHSRNASVMLAPTPKTTAREVLRFKSMNAPAVLVSPALSTGYDFPYGECGYQIIGKIAFPDTRSPVMKERCERDKELSSYLAMQELVQSSGRGIRAVDDKCEIFIVDDNIKWFLFKNKHLSPKWFVDSYQSGMVIPQPFQLGG